MENEISNNSLSSSPENPYLAFTEARIYILHKKKELALERLKNAIDMRPEFKEITGRQREFRTLKEEAEYIRLIS